MYSHLLQQPVWQFSAAESVQEGLTEFLQTRKCPVSRKLCAVQYFVLTAMNHYVELCRRGIRTFQSQLALSDHVFIRTAFDCYKAVIITCTESNVFIFNSQKPVDNRRLSTRPWSHEDNHRLGKYFGIFVEKVKVKLVSF